MSILLVGAGGATVIASAATAGSDSFDGIHFYLRAGVDGNATLTFSAGSFDALDGSASSKQWDAPPGADVTITATAEPGWRFVGWTTLDRDGILSSSPCSGATACRITLRTDLSELINACSGYCPYLAAVTAVLEPVAQAADLSLSSISLPAGVDRPGLSVREISADGRYILYSHLTWYPEVDAEQPAYAGEPMYFRRFDRRTGSEAVVGSVDVNDFGRKGAPGPTMTNDGRFVVYPTDSQDRSKFWDATTGESVDVGDGGAAVISPGGAYLAWQTTNGEPADDFGSNVVIRVFDRVKQTTWEVPGTAENGVVFSGDDSTILIGTSTYATATGALKYTLNAPEVEGRVIRRLSRDGRYGVGAAAGKAFRADFISNTVQVSSWVSNEEDQCFGPASTMVLSSDGSTMYLTSLGGRAAYGDPNKGNGPLEDGAFDYYGKYRIDFGAEEVTVSSASGILTRTMKSSCSGVAATSDAKTTVWGSDLILPPRSQTYDRSAPAAASPSDKMIVARPAGGTLPPTGQTSLLPTLVGVGLAATGLVCLALRRRVVAPLRATRNR